MATRVDTRTYEISHARKPRGYGSWAFFFEHEAAPRFFRGSYGEAKKQAVAAARAAGVEYVSVGP